jgi:hypothetical protein
MRPETSGSPREEMAMTWTTFHRRGEVLRTVTETADSRCDGLLPMEVPGVAETFGDELSLLGALQLRWHTRLSGHLERELMHQPSDIEGAVVTAWHATADELPGIRTILDHYRAEPVDERMRVTMGTAAAKEHVLLGAMAGRAGARIEDTVAAGRALEQLARESHRPASAEPARRPSSCSLLGRIRAHVAA